LIKQFYNFGTFQIDVDRRLLRRDGEPVALAPKVFDMLLVLVEHGGQVLEKDRLMQMLWPDSEVEEANLPQNISALRKALGESPNERKYIVTIPGRGYRFAADINEVGRDESELIVERYSKATLVIQEYEKQQERFTSIAVLPFVNMSADAENDYFCDGLAEELINALTKIERLRVVSRTSAFSFKGKDADVREIGRQLNVSAVIEGSVRKSSNRLRITVQLINVANGYHLWSERYDRQLKDIFDIQDEISLAIVDALKVKLLGAEKAAVLKRHTENTEAHELYLKGRYFWFSLNPEGWEKSRQCFEQAIEKDPAFALAYSGLSDALIAWGVFTPPNEAFPKAKEAALQALKLDSSLAEAWSSRAAVKYFYERDWAGAESDCRQSIALNPRYVLVHDLYALCLLTQGRFEEGIREASRTCELDPRSGYFSATLGCGFYFARRYDEAEAQFLKGTEIDPEQIWSHIWLLDYYEQMRSYSKALHHRQKLLTLFGHHELAIEIGQVFQQSSYQKVLRKCLDELHQQSKRSYVSPLDFATIHVRLGEPEKAMDWLDKAYEEWTWRLNFLKVSPTWESLHSNPRYNDLLRRMGLPQPYRPAN